MIFTKSMAVQKITAHVITTVHATITHHAAITKNAQI